MSGGSRQLAPRIAAIGITLVAAIAAALGCTPLAAAAGGTLPTSSDGVTVADVDATRWPTVRVAFGADEVDGKTPELTFFENGEALTGVKLYRGEIGEYADRKRTDVMLVLDTSLSMSGTRIQDAVAAGRALIAQARPGDRIGLATFGGDARVVLEPTADHGAVDAALGQVELANRTTLFDAVEQAAGAFTTSSKARRAIVLLSDGTDAGSRANVDEAAGAALKAQAPIFAISIRERADDSPKDMAQLGNGTGGEARTIVDTAGLESLFAELGRRILQPYWIEFRSTAPVRSQSEVGIALGNSARRPDVGRVFRAVPPSTLAGAAPVDFEPPATAKPAKPLVPLPGGQLGILAAAMPFALLVFFLSWTWLQRRSRPDVLARIDAYTARATAESLAAKSRGDEPLLRRLAAPFLVISESFLGKSAYFDRIRARAEQANIAIKPSELFTAVCASAGFGFLLALMFGAKPLLFLVLMPMFGIIPDVWLRMKARKRRRQFEDQLPDVLQGIASSLNAGHSFNQAINAMIKDAPNPTSEEFNRVMTEARLGLPVEDALQHMADRMGSADFEFAVTTVNIQRTVGGSLADILEMVGDTVRNRQQFRKKVKALTSMGQMSAYVLLGMPIFIGGVLGVMSPAYIAPLLFTKPGHFMLAAGCFSMFLGYVACMKIVRVKV